MFTDWLTPFFSAKIGIGAILIILSWRAVEKAKPRFGGWLALVVAFLMIVVPLGAMGTDLGNAFNSLISVTFGLTHDYRMLVKSQWVVDTVTVFLLAVAGMSLYFGKKYAALQLAKILIWTAPVAALAHYAVLPMFFQGQKFGFALATQRDPLIIMGSVLSVTLLIGLYLSLSSHVSVCYPKLPSQKAARSAYLKKARQLRNDLLKTMVSGNVQEKLWTAALIEADGQAQKALDIYLDHLVSSMMADQGNSQTLESRSPSVKVSGEDRVEL